MTMGQSEAKGDRAKGLGIGETVSSVLKRRVVKSSAERNREILEAALALFAERGFSDTTMEEVANAAGVAKGTLYIYFDSKEHILLALKRQFLDGLLAELTDVAADAVEALSAGAEVDYRDVVDEILEAIVAYHTERSETLRVVVTQSPGAGLVQEALELERDLVGLVTNTIRQASEFGLIHSSDPDMTARLLSDALRDNLATCLCYGDPADLDRLVAASKELFYKALAPDVSQPPRRPRPVRDRRPKRTG
jgi:AcrR family transcriptional regulator